MDLRHVEERLVLLLRRAAGWLPPEQLTEMESLAKAGEPGVALENFCTQLQEYDLAVPTDVAQELKEIAAMMGMTVSRWIEQGRNA
jgi:hypothetical protein